MKIAALVLALSAVATTPVIAADPATIDWSKIPTTNLTLFYPGQSSYEWLRSSAHPGSGVVQSGGACLSCHKGEENAGRPYRQRRTARTVARQGQEGTVDLNVHAAYDAKNAYLRFQWKTLNPYPGTEHQYLRFDGQGWKVYGYPKLDKVVQDGKQPGIYEDRMTIMIDDGKVPRIRDSRAAG